MAEIPTATDVASPSSLDELRARTEHGILCLNAGDPDPLLARYREDVVVTVALSGVSDPAIDFVVHGKAAYRRYLLTFLGLHRGFQLIDVSFQDRLLIVRVVTLTGEARKLLVTMDGAGLASRVTILGDA